MQTVVSMQRLVYRSYFKHLVQLLSPNVCEKEEDDQEFLEYRIKNNA